MESGAKTKRLKIGGMTCISCQNKIERRLRNMAGVKNAKVSYGKGSAEFSYDAGIVSLRDIIAAIEKLDYKVLTEGGGQEANIGRVVGTLLTIVSLYVLLSQFGLLNYLVPGQTAESGMSYGMLFVIGLITSVHCIAMCGGINLSQCIPRGEEPAEGNSRASAFRPAFLYNLGRVISYTVIGGVLGLAGLLFGGADAGIPILTQGILKLAAGVFMVIMGINMLGLFPWLRRLRPRMPNIFARKIRAEKARRKGPFIVGVLNGIMPCGPLQAMQLVALVSGKPLAGALSMFLFSMGTVPLMLGLGSLVSALGKRFTQKVMTAGAVLVVVLGLSMLAQGGSLSGLLLPDTLLAIVIGACVIGIVSGIPFKRPRFKALSTAAALGLAIVIVAFWNTWAPGGAAAEDGGVKIADGAQLVTSTLSEGGLPNITVQAGKPVKWTINAPDGSINGCNNRINIMEYGIFNYALHQGENVIEFTPDGPGRFGYSCWMGMLYGTITVVREDGAEAAGGAGTEKRNN